MRVLIATPNQDIAQSLTKTKLTFTPATKNTCTFSVSEKTFAAMLIECKARGYNQYGLFTW
jgi:hypothetical protein